MMPPCLNDASNLNCMKENETLCHERAKICKMAHSEKQKRVHGCIVIVLLLRSVCVVSLVIPNPLFQSARM